MAELTGFPELGALALLYYRAGGTLDGGSACFVDDGTTEPSRRTSAREPLSDSIDEEGGGCGCGLSGCGGATTTCFFAIPPSSRVMDSVLRSLDEFAEWMDGRNGREGSFASSPTAGSVLAALSVRTKGKREVHGSPVTTLSQDVLHGTSDACPLYDAGDSGVLRFWETSSAKSKDEPSSPRRPSPTTTRNLPPVVQLLLLKLLYSSPVGGPFLHLACEAIPHLSVAMTPSSKIGRSTAREYKSHWAYFVLIRAVVLGERVKVHRRGTAVPYHVPVWDATRGVDRRKFPPEGGGIVVDAGSEGTSRSEGEERRADETDGLVGCGQELRALVSAFDSPVAAATGSEDAPSFQRIGERVARIRPRCLPRRASHPPLFVLGDSHVLSLGWQIVRIRRGSGNGGGGGEYGDRPPVFRTAVPFPATGLKAWHTRPGTRFFTHHNLNACLERLPPACQTILLSAGEIDCREGIGGKLLEGYYDSCDDAVRNTVNEYVRSVEILARHRRLQILLLPVPPHAYRSEKNGKSAGRAMRRERTALWNDELRRSVNCLRDGSSAEVTTISIKPCVFLLDYEEGLRCPDESSPVGFVLDKSYNADFTHMNGAFLPLLEEALEGCGCDLELI